MYNRFVSDRPAKSSQLLGERLVVVWDELQAWQRFCVLLELQLVGLSYIHQSKLLSPFPLAKELLVILDPPESLQSQ